MKANLTEIGVVLDESGSMGFVRGDTIGGFNTFLEDQKKLPGEAKFTLVKFANGATVIHDGVPIGDVPPLDESTYAPGGGTALLDALGNAINSIEQRIEGLPDDEKPSRVILVIITDGHENASREFGLKQIKKMIEERQASRFWEFLFLAANIDAFAGASSIGVAGMNTSAYRQSAKGMSAMYMSSSERVGAMRGGLSAADLGQFEVKDKDDKDAD